MPLSASVLVNQEEVLELLESARAELPEEIKQARWVVKDREELLAKARRDGEAIVHKAQQELGRSIAQVRRGRDKLRGVTPAQEEFGSDEVFDEEEQG